MAVLEAILANPRIPREALRVLGILIGHIDWSNRVHLQVQEIAALLKIAPQNASRGLLTLREEGIVTRIRQGQYEVHPEVLHIGSLASGKRRTRAQGEREVRP